jgi:hypothetical protein
MAWYWLINRRQTKRVLFIGCGRRGDESKMQSRKQSRQGAKLRTIIELSSYQTALSLKTYGSKIKKH